MYRDFRQKQAALEAKVLAGKPSERSQAPAGHADRRPQSVRAQALGSGSRLRRHLRRGAADPGRAVGIELRRPGARPAAGSARRRFGSRWAAAEGAVSGGMTKAAARSRLWVPGRRGAPAPWSLVLRRGSASPGHQGQSVERDAAARPQANTLTITMIDGPKRPRAALIKRRLPRWKRGINGAAVNSTAEKGRTAPCPRRCATRRLPCVHPTSHGSCETRIATRSPFLLVLLTVRPAPGRYVCEPPGAGRALERALPRQEAVFLCRSGCRFIAPEQAARRPPQRLRPDVIRRFADQNGYQATGRWRPGPGGAPADGMSYTKILLDEGQSAAVVQHHGGHAQSASAAAAPGDGRTGGDDLARSFHGHHRQG